MGVNASQSFESAGYDGIVGRVRNDNLLMIADNYIGYFAGTIYSRALSDGEFHKRACIYHG